jgi:hypothetical protein
VKTKLPPYILKALSSEDDVYIYVNQGNDLYRNGVVVLFQYMEANLAKKIHTLLEFGILTSEEADDYIWDKCVLHYSISRETPERLECVKSTIANMLMLHSVLDTPESVAMIYNLANHYEGDSFGAIIKTAIMSGISGLSVDEIESMTSIQMGKFLTIALGTQQKDFGEFYRAITDEESAEGDPSNPPSVQTLEEVVREEMQTRAPNTNADYNSFRGPTITRNGEAIPISVEQAQGMSEYKDVFRVMEKISKENLTDEQVALRYNPNGIINGSEVINGKIIKDQEHKKVDRSKVKIKRQVRG